MDLIVHLEGGWRQGSAGSQLQLRLREWAEVELAFAPFGGSAERLLRHLRTAPDLERDVVLGALVRHASEDQLAGQLVLEALLPGLKSLVRQLLLDASQRDEVWAIVLACVWERIRRYPSARRPNKVAANLLLDTRHDTLRALRRSPDAPRTVTLDTRTLEETETAAPEPDEDVITVLRRAVRSQAITKEEARLIIFTRIDGRSLADLATETNVGYDALRLRRRRAERRLLLFLGDAAVRFGGRNRHICTARAVRLSGAGSASGGAVTDRSPSRR